jgi:hypothetical protein
MPGQTTPVSPLLEPYIRFFHKRRDLLRDARVVADAAVLRSFPSQVFGGPMFSQLTSRAENLLIENRGCFQIVYDHQLADLSRYRALVLAGCVAMSDEQVARVRKYVAAGGRLCVIGPLATHDGWMMPRDKPALDDLPAAAVVRVVRRGVFAGDPDQTERRIRQAAGRPVRGTHRAAGPPVGPPRQLPHGISDS